MKSLVGVVLVFILMFLLGGCSKNEQPTVEDDVSSSISEGTSYSESYTDISKTFSDGGYLGRFRNEIVLPAECLFMESSEAFGYDNISIYGVCGTLTMMVKDNATYSCTFGSTVFNDKTELNVKLNELNSKLADALGVEEKEFVFVSNDKEIDEYEAIFSCKGILKVEYETEQFKLTVSAIGTNYEAIITLTQLQK